MHTSKPLIINYAGYSAQEYLTANQEKFALAKPVIIEKLNTFYRQEQQLHQLNWQLENGFKTLNYNQLIADEINRITYQEFSDGLKVLAANVNRNYLVW
ncbi:hypothetical protein [Thalassotalea euphylliae]|uniref:hypothetical protein n=1 Tax=Thalassotalea euphylliae TaxID=1655234 RepID=UPI0011C019FE|nr:hypothetical protein [Thalassotalea euphylliae]